MKMTDPDERRKVRVRYVARGYGLALTIDDDEHETVHDAGVEEPDSDDGYLTVVASGVTTLELRRSDGGSSMLIWDEAEVSWDSLLAG